MAQDEEPRPDGVEWLERDSRDWEVLSHTHDQMTARMACTYLETAGVEARVGTSGGRYCVEVPADQLERALQVHAPADSEIAPPLEESGKKTGIHTGHRLREALKNPEAEPPPKQPRSVERTIKWVLRVAVLAILAALLLLIFAT